jgi:hypothetical protein
VDGELRGAQARRAEGAEQGEQQAAPVPARPGARRDGELVDVADAVLPAAPERDARDAGVVLEHEPQPRVEARQLDARRPPLRERLRHVALDLRERVLHHAVDRRLVARRVERAHRRGRAHRHVGELGAHAEVVLGVGVPGRAQQVARAVVHAGDELHHALGAALRGARLAPLAQSGAQAPALGLRVYVDVEEVVGLD